MLFHTILFTLSIGVTVCASISLMYYDNFNFGDDTLKLYRFAVASLSMIPLNCLLTLVMFSLFFFMAYDGAKVNFSPDFEAILDRLEHMSQFNHGNSHSHTLNAHMQTNPLSESQTLQERAIRFAAAAE